MFKVNLSESFFTPRLSGERLRVTKKIGGNEVVLNMFAGVGTFSIVIGRVQPTATIYSIDSNPRAYELMIENILLNRLWSRVKAFEGDAAEVIFKNLVRCVDRVLMPLPDKSRDYLPSALLALKNSGGVIHYCAHKYVQRDENALQEVSREITPLLPPGAALEDSRIVRKIGLRRYRIVFDL